MIIHNVIVYTMVQTQSQLVLHMLGCGSRDHRTYFVLGRLARPAQHKPRSVEVSFIFLFLFFFLYLIIIILTFSICFIVYTSF